MQEQTQKLREYFARVSPHLPELFNVAHAITGNYDLAEYALLRALVSLYRAGKKGGLAFREELRETTIRYAIPEAQRTSGGDVEMTWEMLNDGTEDPVSRRMFAGSTDLRRISALRYGCNLSHGKISKITGLSESNVRDMLSQMERRVKRSMGEKDRRHPETAITEWMRKRFSEPDRVMPPANMIYRSFESEVTQEIKDSEPRHRVSKVLTILLGTLLAVIGISLFWICSVLLQSQTPLN